MSNRLPRLALRLSALSIVLAAPAAHATGFLVDQYGADEGQPALGNAYSVFFNPAAMAGAQGTDLMIDGMAFGRQLSFNRSSAALSPNPATPAGQSPDPTYVAANTGQAQLFNVLAAPYLGMVTDFGGSHWRLGIAGYVPFGGTVSWSKNQVFQNYPGAPGAYDGAQRWATISTNSASMYGTAALAYRFEQAHLGIGANVSVIRTTIQDTRARNPDGSDNVLTPANGIAEGRATIDMSGVEVGAALGAYWEPTSALRLGASYTSQPNFGTMRLSGTFHQWNQGADGGVEKADMLQAYPDVIRLGAAWRVAKDAELRLDGSWQRWSQFKDQCIVLAGSSCNVDATGAQLAGSQIVANVPRNFQDAYKIRLGAAYWLQPQTEIFGSGAFETSPVTSAYEDPLLFDSVRLYGTLGVRESFTPHFYAMAAYTYVYMLPVTVTDSAFNTYKGVSRTPAEDGSYSSDLFIFDLALGYLF